MPIQIDAARKGSIAQFIKEKVEVGATVCSGGRKVVPARSACLGFRLFILSKDKKRHRKVSFESIRTNQGEALYAIRQSRNVIISQENVCNQFEKT